MGSWLKLKSTYSKGEPAQKKNTNAKGLAQAAVSVISTLTNTNPPTNVTTVKQRSKDKFQNISVA